MKGEELAGKTLSVSANLKCITAPGAQVWLQVDQFNGHSQTEESEEIRIGGWKSVSVTTKIPEDAKAVRIGIRSTNGDVLVDNIDVRCES
ncbi:MAG: hypothetical protein HONBIEJF_02809 [Fimbriimonadaceae bacterium]|nr:hypothetical protein [Fimbriimonadaceae bacterium]